MLKSHKQAGPINIIEVFCSLYNFVSSLGELFGVKSVGVLQGVSLR